MPPGLSSDTNQRSLGAHSIFIRASAIVAVVCACAAFLLLAANADQRDLPRDSLWEVVHNICVPGQSENHNPAPCLRVDLSGGIESGFVILRDPRGGSQFLLVPTVQISGIESPIVRGPNATNYFAIAWENRTLINDALHLTLPRDDFGLAINSAASRSQDQLHIHISCIRADVWEALHQNAGRIGDDWATFNVPFSSHYYTAMWVAGERLGSHNPFRLLAEGFPDATRDMSDRTLVVIGLTRADGTKGFVLLTKQGNRQNGDRAFGEELLDRACHIVSMGIQAQGSVIEREGE
ncbi:MAG TPA: CDP-diacylglycerol diphosphatase [Candidatus Acidoferrales bacterium]|nr:CDP-diacylglycerol diphosphatase [Candidatus Acidoferrales bacterium]